MRCGRLYQCAFFGAAPSPATRETILAFGSEEKTYVHRLSGVMAAAVLRLALMGCAVAAAAYGGSIQSWFGHDWEAMNGQPMSEGHTAVIDHLSMGSTDQAGGSGSDPDRIDQNSGLIMLNGVGQIGVRPFSH